MDHVPDIVRQIIVRKDMIRGFQKGTVSYEQLTAAGIQIITPVPVINQ